MMREEKHLRALRDFCQDLQGGRGAEIIAMDQDVVENHRARGNSGYMVFDSSQRESEIKRIARAIAQSWYSNLFLVLPNGDHDRLIVVSEGSRKAVVFAQSQSGK